MKRDEKVEITSFFDLDKKQLPDNVECTLYRLCKEIGASTERELGNEPEDLIKKFHNNKGTGIIDHLKEDLNFDVYDYKKNMFQVLQFLKLIYRYEKDKPEKNNAFQITKVLRRPRVENIKSPYYEASTLYGESIEHLIEELESVIGIEEARKRKKTLAQRNQRWLNTLSRIMELSFNEEALKPENIKTSKNELIVAKNYFQNNIYDQLEQPDKHIPSDNIFLGFYTLLIEHIMLCEEEDRIKTYAVIEKYSSNDDEYIKTFVKWENYIVTKEWQEAILEKLIKDHACLVTVDKSESDVVDLKYLIFGSKEELNKNDMSGLRTARKYLHVLTKWIKEQKPSEIPENRLLLSWFVTIVQEIIYCNKNDIKVRNDAYGVKVKEKTLTATLKNAEKADTKHIQEWMIRIENRYNVNIGGGELQGIVREIEVIFQKIRRWALQHHDLKDFIFVDNALVHTVERMIVPRFVAVNKLDELGQKLINTGLVRRLVYDNYGSIGVLNLGRELALDKSLMEKLVWLLSDDMKLLDKATVYLEPHKERIEVQGELYKGYFDENVSYVLVYYLCANGDIIISYFRPEERDEIIYKYKSYGLGKLGITGKE